MVSNLIWEKSKANQVSRVRSDGISEIAWEFDCLTAGLFPSFELYPY